MGCKGILVGVAAVALAGCVLDRHVAGAPADAGPPDGSGGDGDGDGGEGGADAGGTGLHAVIGERPEVTGNCSALDDRAEMLDRFDPPVQEMDVRAGWDFDTDADSYDDPSYGFDPSWPGADSGRFSLRFHGRLGLPAGPHCLSIDIGATGTDIIGGRNACGQIYLAGASAPLAETGYGADGDATGCVTVGDGGTEVDVVFWYFNIFEQAILHVRHCAGAACSPDQPIGVGLVTPL
ncbi:MAG TPA: hypothetical protein VL172_21070 [Kofleriaceae bacterium]|nr:hypothetical protein [Kofleriaceae bacterium]